MSKVLKIAIPGLVLFLLALASLLPLRTATEIFGPAGFGYQRVEGTVWHGMFHYPRLGRQEARSLAVSLSPAGLLTGTAVADFRLTGEHVSGSGTLSLSGSTTQLRDAGIDLNLDRRAGDMRFRGTLYLSIDRLALTDKGCEQIDGLFRTDILGPLKSMGLWSAAEATGDLACNDGRINIAMTDGEGEGAESRRLSFSFDPLQMRLDTDISVKTVSAELVNKLTRAGFRKRNDRWVWHHQERIG
ncbi:type II secretion system protein N [Emcibacter nanhaiensis]|uniref:Type II secretion system protein N n=1 Tax=Emcibacter nanhaiensis TaxID=1505037 RepID=A0A501PQ45_9PROT|nr:type II secretion system protein N [Emcibacter nanhaiensis]TPD62649.1 type II secretion system protein N [Emcibacter nanhaiensis]